jgi:hypothetical protein
MSTKTREVIWGGRVIGAKMRAETARQETSRYFFVLLLVDDLVVDC